jgi:hypothetical protein
MDRAESALRGFASVFNDGGHLQHLDWHPDR